MSRYRIDGIEYEIADSVDLASTVARIRALPDHKPKTPKVEDSYAKRVLTEGIPGAAAGIGNLALDIGRSIPAGVAGLVSGIASGSGEQAMETMGNVSEFTKEYIPSIPDPSEGAFQGILEKGMGYVGDLGEAQGQPGGPVNMVPAPEFASPGMRTGAEAASNFLPIPGARMAGRIPHIGTEWKAGQAAKAQALEILRKKIEAEAQAKKNYETAEMPADLFGEKDPHANQPGTRSPYMIPEAERLRIEEEMRQTEAEAGRNGQPQADLFETPDEAFQRRLSEPRKSAREGEILDVIPQDRPGNVPGVYPELVERGVYEGQEARVIEPPATVEPGFPLGRKKRGVKEKSAFITPEQLFKDDLDRLRGIKQDDLGSIIDLNEKRQEFNLKQYASQFRGDIRQHVAEMHKRAAERPDWTYQVGDKIKSTKTGKAYEITGHAWDLKKDVPFYFYRSLDGLEKGSFNLKAEQPGQFERMTGPKARQDLGSLNEHRPETPGYNASLVARQSDGSSVRSQLEAIRDTSQIPYYRMLAEESLSRKDFNPRFKLEKEITDSEGQVRDWGGSYRYSEDRVRIREDMLGQEQPLLHEVKHAEGAGIIRGVFRGLPEFARFRPAVHRLDTLYQSFKNEKLPADWKSRYGLSSLHEFWSEGWTRPEFQALLARLELPKHLQTNKLRTYWNAFLDRIAPLLGKGAQKGAQTYLSEFLKAGADLLEGSDAKSRTFFKDELADKDLGVYSLKEFKKDLVDKGIKLPDTVAESMYAEQTKKTVVPETKDQPVKTALRGVKGLKDLRRELMDDRPLAELAEEISAHKDISFAQANTLSKLGNPDYMAKDHPTIAWSISQINRVKNQRTQEIHNLLFGETGTKKAPAPGSFYHKWKDLTVKERTEVNDVGQALNNTGEKLSREAIQAKARELVKHDLSEAQLQAYTDRLTINSAILKKINAYLLKEGKEPIHELPHYWSPAEFEGRFIVTITDPVTGAKIVRGSYLRPNVKKLEAAFPGKTISEPLERGRRASFDMEQYEVILRHLNKEMRDPATRALAEGYRRAGFGKHGLKREGAGGALGTEGGRKGLDKYEEVSEKYIRQAHEYLGNRDIDRVFTEMSDFEPAKRQPNSHRYALEALDQARGGMNKTMEALSDGVGLAVRSLVQMGSFGKVVPPTSIVRDILRPLNQGGSALLLGFGNPAFLAQNALQSSFAIPKMLSMGPEYGGLGFFTSPAAVIAASFRAQRTLRKGMTGKHPDIEALARIGTHEATLHLDWESYASEFTKNVSGIKHHGTGMSLNLLMESKGVRLPSSVAFLEMLRGIGYDKYLERIGKPKEEIYQMTKIITDDYMVSMARYKKAHVFGRSGLVGTTLGPLQSFMTNWIAQLREFSKQAAKSHQNPANALPLVSFMAISMLTAGLTNLIASKEYDLIVGLLNEHFHMKLPMYEELMLSVVKSDFLRFGAIAEATGLNLGALFSPPTVTGSYAVGVQLGVNIVDTFVKALRETGMFGEMNKLKEAEKRDALKTIFPRSTWWYWEDKYTPEGAPTQTKKGSAGPYTRTEKDKLARKFSTYTLEEQKGKMLQYPAEQKMKQRSERLKTSTSLMVDAMLTGENPQQRIATLVRDLSEDQYSSKEIREALKEQFKAKVTEKDIRMMGKGKTTRQKLLIQYWNSLR